MLLALKISTKETYHGAASRVKSMKLCIGTVSLLTTRHDFD